MIEDIMTIKIKITRKNYPENSKFSDEKSGFIHSSAFPFIKNEVWYLFFASTDEKDIFYKDKVT